MRDLLPMILSLSLSACATTPLTVNQTVAVPESRVLAPQFLSQTSNSGSLVVKRDSGFMGIRVYDPCFCRCRSGC